MPIRQAAENLLERLKGEPWLFSVGIGRSGEREVIYVFLRKAARSNFLEKLKSDGWIGFPVIVQRTGSPHPAHP